VKFRQKKSELAIRMLFAWKKRGESAGRQARGMMLPPMMMMVRGGGRGGRGVYVFFKHYRTWVQIKRSCSSK
jgi:hypothetical protein